MVEEALRWYGRIFAFELRGRGEGMAFVDLGDQFIAFQDGRRQVPDDGRHFRPGGRRPVPRLPRSLGQSGRGREYRSIQFTKTGHVLAGMELEASRTRRRSSSATRGWRRPTRRVEPFRVRPGARGLAPSRPPRHLTCMTEARQDFMNLPVATAPPAPEPFWRKVRRTLARLAFAEDLVAAWYCALDRDTPAYVRAVLAGALAYFMLPADAIPDVLAALGFTDDASVLAAAITAVGRHMQPKHRRQARQALDRLSS